MLINGINLSALGATLNNRVLSSNKVNTKQQWADGSLEPTFIRQQDTFKSIQLQFLITEQNEEDAFVIMSNLTMLLKKAIIIFDDMPNLQFDVTMKGESKQERLTNGNFILTVDLKSDYAKGETAVYTTNTAATDSFNLALIYYKDDTVLISNESIKIKSSDFEGNENVTFADLGIDVNKYQQPYYNNGVVTNFGNTLLTYSNLYSLGVLIINYAPTVYYKNVEYFLWNGVGYDLISSELLNFTHKQIEDMTTIGQLVDLNKNRPSGYKATCKFDQEFTFNNIMNLATAIPVYYDLVEEDRTKNVTINYTKETESGDLTFFTQDVVIKESDVVDGTKISTLLNLNKQKPNNYYEDGYCVEVDDGILLTFDGLLDTYNIYYALKQETIYVEYYKGEYPDWQRVHTDTLTIKYKDEYATSENIITDLNINLDKYKTEYYESGIVFNENLYENYDALINIRGIQVYYPAKVYTITVNYKKDLDGDVTFLNSKDYSLTEMMFSTDPKLAEIIDINLYRPDGFTYDENDSYHGPATLSALTQASPLTIVYKATTVVRTKSIVIRYLKQLSSTFSTINSSVVTIEEAAVGGGIKIKDLFQIDRYKPEYYESGIIDGYSKDTVLAFDEINGTYEVYYYASTYTTQVRYYTDEVNSANWVGSSRISYTILSFDENTTLASLGLDINAYKPPYSTDGEVQSLGGGITFTTLQRVDAINIIYPSIEEPGDDTGIDYPHRILFLHHNDLGPYEKSAPRTWTLNHAYINTGVIADNIEKTTVEISTLVMPEKNLINANVAPAFLFGAKSPRGSLYMGYYNKKEYPHDDTHNQSSYYFAKAGYGVNEIQVVEPNVEKYPTIENGFSRKTGIYASEKLGYSYWTLTHTQLIPSDNGDTEVPLYLFACNNNGNYQGGIANVGITSCRIYKEGVLVRDFIPVQYYDLIGTQVAPSNCLYDKVTQTFFEDATGLESFNIIDDDEYPQDNPLHKIGKFYVNYYKDGGFFQSRVVYFRESDLINGYDLLEQLKIEEYKPRFYGIPAAPTLPSTLSYNYLNNKVFEINYPLQGYYITVNYYRDSNDSENLLRSDQIYLSEENFYQVPTFGQLCPLLKYKPEGYELKAANYPYKQNKVTLERIVQNAPYDIVYTPIEAPSTYSFTVSYYKHRNVIDPKHPLNQYELIGVQTIVVSGDQIIDGVYPEQFMDFNLMKPEGEENYWYDGQPFEWYTEDENLLTPDELKENYNIVYEPRKRTVQIKYYTDEVDADDFNLIATDSWSVKINDWGFGELFQIIDELPNKYINKYKPITCTAGVIQEPDRWYTFNDLITYGHIDIVYTTKEEPHDPEDDSFPNKVLFWYQTPNKIEEVLGESAIDYSRGHAWQFHHGAAHPTQGQYEGLKIPYINLGYTPKEIGRLAIQAKAYSVADSCWNNGWGYNYAPITDAYTYFIGYMAGPTFTDYRKAMGYDNGKDALFGHYSAVKNYQLYSNYSPNSNGWIAIRGHIPEAVGFSQQFYSVHNVDGNNGWKWSNSSQSFYRTVDASLENVKELIGGFRLGKYASLDENLNYYTENHDHVYQYRKRNSTTPAPIEWNRTMWGTRNHEACSFSNGLDYIWAGAERWSESGAPSITSLPVEGDVYADNPDYEWTEFRPATAFHPTTMTVDAYNKFVEIYDMSNDQNPIYYNVDTSSDYDLFLDRGKPKGPIRLFTTTNPETGEPNVAPDSYPVYGYIRNYRTQISGTSNYHNDDEEEAEGGQQNVPGTNYESHGGLLDMAYNPYTTQGIDCPWSGFRYNAFPSIMRTMIWGVKIWDRGKLVRDLIPVEKGDQIYNYVAPYNGLFDKITEIFFTTENKGDIGYDLGNGRTASVTADQVYPLRVKLDPTIYGKIVVNYYDYDNSFLGNKWVSIPTDYFASNILFKDLLAYNDMKPSDFYHDGILDTDTGLEDTTPLRTRLKEVYDAGSINIYYKQKQYTKTVVYYNENTRIASKDFFFSQHEIEEANTLADLGIDPELYRTDEFAPGVVMSDETIIASDDVAAFIDAPSPVVVYHKYTKEERPDLFYVEYYRGGAYEPEGQETLTVNAENANYLDCDMTAVVLNPNGLTKYVNHYHSALYEDEVMPYFIAYQVDITANYVPVHKGPARAYTLLGHIVDRGRYTIIEVRNGWGRLKEYPKGWILLSYTRQITGPGQNPDYDPARPFNVGIPFGVRLSITKMTIDRLWAYTPDYNSWIKTEEISFDQSGRLYNALAMKVIHLDQLNWSDISSLEGMGIDVQQYRLRFHDRSSYTYNGPFTQEALSDIHSIDIVYPETIYPYVVKYYLNTITEDTVIGRGGFSCSLSDWNPDWDTFLSTSWLTGYDAKIKSATNFYRVVGKTETKSIGANTPVLWLRNREKFTYNGIQCYYILWNGLLGYVPANTLTSTDNMLRTISPTLYRSGQPLMLTWDFFELDRNRYKPDYSYTDGIMLWNPHTYDNKILNFSFEELITTGGQKILYVPKVDMDYVAAFSKGFYRIPLDISSFNYIPTNTNPGVWDVEIKYRNNYYKPTYYENDGNVSHAYQNYLKEACVLNDSCVLCGEGIEWIKAYIDSEGFTGNYSYRTIFSDGINIYNRTAWLGEIDEGTPRDPSSTRYYPGSYVDADTKNTYYNIINFSNKRPADKAVAILYGNERTEWECNEPSFRSRKIALASSNSTNVDSIADMTYINIGSGVARQTSYEPFSEKNNTIDSYRVNYFWYIKTWHNYELTHYYVPLPKGYWLPSGRQATENGFYDLITQNFVYDFSVPRNSSVTSFNGMQRPSVYRIGYTGGVVDYFGEWEYNTEDVNYLVETKADTQIYKYPDIYSSKLGTIDAHTLIPVNKLTADSEHHVQGTWYYIESGWIQATSCKMASFNGIVNPYRREVALKGDVSNTSKRYYGYKKPTSDLEDNLDGTYWYLARDPELSGRTQTVNTAFGTLRLPYTLEQLSKIEIKIHGKISDNDKTTSSNYIPGTIISNGSPLVFTVADLKTTMSFNSPITVQATKKANQTDWYVWGPQGYKSFPNATNNYAVCLGYWRGLGINGSPLSLPSGSKTPIAQIGIQYYSVKAWDNDGNLVYSVKPKLVLYENKYKLKLYDEISDTYVIEGNYITNATYPQEYWLGDLSPGDEYLNLESKNSFTSEGITTVYNVCNDFYWNGKIWIPASYTDDYKVMWDEPKTYICKVDNIYDRRHPLESGYWRVNNYLIGDRLIAVGNLGKDPNWYLLENGKWIFQNDTFEELMT